jgi:hypothetical protein
MSYITVNYVPSVSAAPRETVIPSDMTVGTFLEEVQGITNFSNVTIEINGTSADLSAPLENGDTVALVQKKTDSGQK